MGNHRNINPKVPDFILCVLEFANVKICQFTSKHSAGVRHHSSFSMAHSRESTKVVVVGGGGTMGSSTALHLIRSGYNPLNITVLDVYPIPSAQSAGYDLNKIMSIRLRNEADLQLSLEALDMWQNDELFKPFFHKVGMVSQHSISIIQFA